jgi:hypothetical protein
LVPRKKRGICDKIQSSLGELRPTSKAAANINPEEYIRYFEDFNRVSNAEIGPISRRLKAMPENKTFWRKLQIP